MPDEQKIDYEVGIQHELAGKIYTFVTSDSNLKAGDAVMVEEENGGMSLAFVINPPKESGTPQPRRRVLRKATADDMKRADQLEDRAAEYLRFSKERVRDRNLDMKIVGARYCEEGKKLIFFFTADDRVDFRSLVKELAQTLKVRIELRQVGSRDGSKFLSCTGPCGRQTCCSSFLRGFKPVSMGMAKNQDLSPNPTKLTGMCGKLQCCLCYEDDVYKDLRTKMPRVGTRVRTSSGDGVVMQLSIASQSCRVKFEDERDKFIKISQITEFLGKQVQAPKPSEPAAEEKRTSEKGRRFDKKQSTRRADESSDKPQKSDEPESAKKDDSEKKPVGERHGGRRRHGRRQG